MKATAKLKRPVPQVTMMAPYSKKEADVLGRSLPGLKVGSLGPGVCTRMLTLAEQIERVIASDHRLDPSMMKVLAEYRAKLIDVCCVDAGAQAALIEILSGIVEKGTDSPK